MPKKNSTTTRRTPPSPPAPAPPRFCSLCSNLIPEGQKTHSHPVIHPGTRKLVTQHFHWECWERANGIQVHMARHQNRFRHFMRIHAAIAKHGRRHGITRLHKETTIGRSIISEFFSGNRVLPIDQVECLCAALGLRIALVYAEPPAVHKPLPSQSSTGAGTSTIATTAVSGRR